MNRSSRHVRSLRGDEGKKVCLFIRFDIMNLRTSWSHLGTMGSDEHGYLVSQVQVAYFL